MYRTLQSILPTTLQRQMIPRLDSHGHKASLMGERQLSTTLSTMIKAQETIFYSKLELQHNTTSQQFRLTQVQLMPSKFKPETLSDSV
jgi:hypothetical protein